MHRLAILIVLALGTAMIGGCQSHGSPYPQAQQGYGYQPGYEQTFPQPVQSQAPGRFGSNAGRVLGDLAGGFVRSAVGGAGFTAGRDLWNSIIR